MPIETELRQFITTTFAPDVPADQLPLDLDLLDGGIIDSLGLLRFIAWVGEHYGIPVDQEEISPADFNSVASVTAYVQRSRTPS